MNTTPKKQLCTGLDKALEETTVASSSTNLNNVPYSAATVVDENATLGAHRPSIPDSEVTEHTCRRKFTAAYKLRILGLADQCTQPGQIGDLLRKEGLYSSNLTRWRKQRQLGILRSFSDNKRGRNKIDSNPLDLILAQLQKENQELKDKLRKAEMIIDVQKKISEILGMETSTIRSLS